MSRNETVTEDELLEALYEIETKHGISSFTASDLGDAPGLGFEMDEILQLLCESDYLSKSGIYYTITNKGHTELNNKPAEWLIEHLPMECHDGQK